MLMLGSWVGGSEVVSGEIIWELKVRFEEIV